MHLDSPLDSFLRSLRNKQVLRLIPDGSSVCDIGCGDNPVLLKALAGRASKRVGLDRMVRNARHNGIELRNSEIGKRPLPIADREFDVITMAAVIEHLENPEGVLKECFRRLKKGGRIILTTPSPRAKPILDSIAWLRLVESDQIREHKHSFGKMELGRLLEKAGFRHAKVWSFETGLNNAAIAFK